MVCYFDEDHSCHYIIYHMLLRSQCGYEYCYSTNTKGCTYPLRYFFVTADTDIAQPAYKAVYRRKKIVRRIHAVQKAHELRPYIRAHYFRSGIGCGIYDIADKTDCLCQPVCHEETITVPFIHCCIVQISYNPKNIAAKINDYCRVHDRYHVIKRGLYIVMYKTACNRSRAPVYTKIEHYRKKQWNTAVFRKYSVKKLSCLRYAVPG